MPASSRSKFTTVSRLREIRSGFLFRSRLVPGLLTKFTSSTIAGVGRFAPIIALRGGSGSGKNRAATTLRLVSYRPFYDLSTLRDPSLYRSLDTWRGALVLDEADTNASESSDFIHLISSRYYGAPISR